MTARRRVLLIIAGLPAGGAERQIALLARGLDRARFEPGLLIFTAAEKIHYPEALDNDIWFRALGLSGRSPVSLVPRLVCGIRGAVRDFRPDILHSSLNVANHLVRTTAILCRWRVPVVTSVRNDFRAGYRPSERLAEKLLWRRSAAISCNSDRVRNQLVADLGIPENRVFVIPNGIDEAFFAADVASPSDDWPDGKVVLFVGRFTQQKNPLALVRAFGEAVSAGVPGEWSLVLVGAGPLEPEIRREVKERGLGGRVLIRPRERDVRRLYCKSSLLVLPSLYEGTPNVCLEAAASGCPIAVTPGASVDAIVSAGGGWLIDETPSAMAHDLAAILALPPTALATAGARGREYVARVHSAAGMIAATEELYGTLSGVVVKN